MRATRFFFVSVISLIGLRYIALACPAYYGTNFSITRGYNPMSVGGGNYPPGGTNNIDVLNYEIHYTDFNFSNMTIEAWTELRIRVMRSMSTNDWLYLDFTPPSGPGITNFFFNGVSNAFFITDDGVYDPVYDKRLKIPPPMDLNKGSIVTVRVSYAGAPIIDNNDAQGGLRLIVNTSGRYAETMSEPNSAHLWFPCNDTPDDKAKFDIFATVSNGMLAAANGKLMAVSTNLQKTTFHWRSTNLVSTYLVSMNVGDFIQIGDVGGVEVPLQGWFSLANAIKGSNGLASARNAMHVYTNAFGPYPFEKYAHVEFFNSGYAMEHQSLSGFPSGALESPSIIAHELAHHWFGNYTGFATWDDLWLAEGWATYSEALFAAGLNNRSETAERMFSRHSINWDKALNNPSYDSLNSLFSYGLVYLRGAWVIHHIRSYLGEESFWKATRYYLRTHVMSNATTDELRESFSDTAFSTAAESNQFSRFFERMITMGAPKIKITYFGETNIYGSVLYFRYDRWDEAPVNCPDVMYTKLQFVGGSSHVERLVWNGTNTLLMLNINQPVTNIIMDPFGDYPSSSANIIVNGTLNSSDADGDFLPDGWELVTLGSTIFTGYDNPDQDMLSNEDEYISGMHPLMSDSFQIRGVDVQDGFSTNRVLTWPYVLGREYSVYWSTNIQNGFTPMATQLLNGTYNDGVHGKINTGYYKVGVKKQRE